MSNPWNDIEKAFEPMFVDTVEISRSNKFTLTVSGYVDINEDEFDSNDSIESTVKTILVLTPYMKIDGWNISDKPQVGDLIKTQDGLKFKVTNVELMHNGTQIKMEGRQCWLS